MRSYHSSFASALSAAPEIGLAPAWFFFVRAKDRDTGAATPMGFWTGDDDISLTVAPPDGSGSEARVYYGACGLRHDGIALVGDLTDQPVSVTLSQIAPATQQLVRGYDARHATCEIHVALMQGGALATPLQLEFVGYIDEAPITTPAADGDGDGASGGAITLSVRSELMHQLTATNPAKSSDAHQKRRQANDQFSRFSGVISDRELQWYKGK